jgi:hypothetical protein
MTSAEQHFWELADEPSADTRVTRSTMMGLPSLRWEGKFFACLDRRSGELVVKLAEAWVEEFVEAGEAGRFAPDGRRFKQWATISIVREQSWAGYLAPAQEFVAAMD